MFVPIFEKDNNRLFILTEEFTAQTRDDAMNIGWGSSLVEAVILQMKFTNEVQEINPRYTPHAKATIANIPVAIISGPLFDVLVKQE